MENSLERDLPENCRMISATSSEIALSGICRPIESSFTSVLIIGRALPGVRADVASALNSRVREIAMWIKPAAIGASSIINSPLSGLHERCSPSRRPAPNHIAIWAN